MKKILLLGDIHANIVALNIVLEEVGIVDKILCTGDIVDYNPWPLESIELVKAHNILSVIGNHDRDSVLGTPVGYNPYAEISCLWTHRQLTSNACDYLLSLPQKMEANIDGVKIFICHGSPNDLIDEYIYPPPITSRETLKGFLEEAKADLVVMGHTHIPFIESFAEGLVVNPGSVGQPRSGNPKASYMILTIKDGEMKVDHHLVNYNITAVAQKISEVGLPPFLASRLYNGI